MRVTSVPDSPWILINLGHGPSTEFRAIDRRGVEGGRLTHRSPIRVRMSADALWAMVLQDQAHPLPLLARVTFDRRTGRFSERVDTVNAGQFTQFDVTGDGGKLVLEEGTSEYRAWAMDLADAFRGTFRENRQLLHATTPIEAWLSRDGGRVVLWREEASSVGGDQVTVRPFGSGTETSLAQSGVLFVNGAGSVDTDQVVLVSRTSAGFQLTLTDLRSGARGTPFTVPENVASTTLPAGGWVWIPPGGRSINIQRHGETTPRSFPVPPYQLASAPSVTPNGSELAFIGYDPATWPLMRLSTMSLSDGTVTEWLAYLCVGSTARWLPDHSILLWVEEPAKIYTVYRVRGPGQKERLGTIPRRIELLSVSNDLRRAAIVTRDYHGDAWMSTVVRP